MLKKFKKSYLYILISLLAFTSCQKSKNSNKIPSCIEDMIMDIQKEDVKNPPTEIWKWKVDGKTYFYITSECCDFFNYLYDENCMVVCAPDGGITGMGDQKCPKFVGEISKTLVWEDERKE